ncbi:MAG: nitroreductase family deazaflavin-dependent oxidoreductase [Actinomycetota bacterium]|nr:nitroreductase family deazaflavin-dependent oxidoreductase [Actinomycetota bacterium]
MAERHTTKRRTRKDTVRAFNKHVLNPVMMRLAGRRYWYAGVIRHVGRRSGTAYATPVVADRVNDGFIVPLPYGSETDWLRNIRAAGRAALQVHGQTYEVTRPEIVDAAVAYPQVPAAHARVWRRLGIEHYLKLTVPTDRPWPCTTRGRHNAE